MELPPDLELVNEQLLHEISVLRSQNEQLWRVIEKQRTIVLQLQQQQQQQQQLPNDKGELPPFINIQSTPSSVSTVAKCGEEGAPSDTNSENSEITRTPSDDLLPTKFLSIETTRDAFPQPIPIISPLLPSMRKSLQNIVRDPSFLKSPMDVNELPQDVVSSFLSVPEYEEHAVANSSGLLFDDSFSRKVLEEREVEVAQAGGCDAPSVHSSPLLAPTDVRLFSSSPNSSVRSSPLLAPTDVRPFSPSPNTSARPARKTFSVFIPPPAGPPPFAVRPSTEQVAVENSSLLFPVVGSNFELNPSVAPLVSNLDELANKSSDEWKSQETSQHVQENEGYPHHLSYIPPSLTQQPVSLPQRPNSESVLLPGSLAAPALPPHLYQKLSVMKLPTPPQLPPRSQQEASSPPQLPPRSQAEVSSQPVLGNTNLRIEMDSDDVAPRSRSESELPQLPPRPQQEVSSQPSPGNTNLRTEVDSRDVAPRARSDSEPGNPPSGHFEANTRSLSHSAISVPSPVTSSETNASPVEGSGLLEELNIRVVGSTIKVNDKGREVLAFTFAVSKKIQASGNVSKPVSELWRFEKFYSDFLAFDLKIKPALLEISDAGGKNVASSRKKLPDKSLFNNCAPNKADQRKAGLEEYLCWILSVPELRRDSTVKEFLSSDVVPSGSSGIHSAAAGDRTEGYLTKKGKSFGKWKTRYFVIRDGLLHYYENKDGNHLGTVCLKYSKIGRQQAKLDDDKDKESGYRHAFIILEPRRNSMNVSNNSTAARHVLCADSDEVRDEWITSLAKVIDGKPLVRKRQEQPRCTSSGDGTVPSSSERSASHENIMTDSETPKKNKASTENLSNSVSPFRSPQSSGVAPPLSNATLHNIQQPNGPQAIIRGQEKPGSTSTLPPSPTVSLFENDQTPPPQHAFKLSKGSNAAITGPMFVERSNRSSSRNTNNRVSVFIPPGMTQGDKRNQQYHINARQRQVPRNRPVNASEAEDSKIVKAGRLALVWGNKKDGKLDLPAPTKPASAQKPTQVPRPLIVPNGGLVFGVPLENAIARARVKEGYELPAVVYRAIEYLEAKDAYQEEGLYRLSGSTLDIRSLRDQYNKNGDFDLVADKLAYHDVHAVAGLLKLYLRELPASVLTTKLQPQFLRVMDQLDRRDQIMELARLVSHLPLANYTLLRALMAHLIKVVTNSSVNKMTIRNIGIVFSPTLGIPAGIFALFVAEFEYIFWVGDSDETAQRTLKETNGMDATEGSRKVDVAVVDPVVVPDPVTSVEDRASATSDTMREYAAAVGVGLEEKERLRRAKVKTEKETRVETWVNDTEPENETFEASDRSTGNSSSFMKGAPAEVVEREKGFQKENMEGLTIDANHGQGPAPDIHLLQPPTPAYSARNSAGRQSGDLYSFLTMYGDFTGPPISPTSPTSRQLAPMDTTAHLLSPVLPLTVRNNRDSTGSDASQKLLMRSSLDRNETIHGFGFEDPELQNSRPFGDVVDDVVVVA